MPVSIITQIIADRYTAELIEDQGDRAMSDILKAWDENAQEPTESK